MTDTAQTVDSTKIVCQMCGEEVHVITSHILNSPAHAEHVEALSTEIAQEKELDDEQLSHFVSSGEMRKALASKIEEKYKADYPLAPLMSELATEEMARRRAKKQQAEQGEVKAESVSEDIELRPMHSVFNLTRSRATKDVDGNAIMVQCYKKGHQFEYLVPKVDVNYVWDTALLKTIIMAVENKIPAYLWGYAGVGKSTGFTQYCAYTNRPMVRVQHTGDTESPHIIGQMLANEQGTYFNPGPLALAMKHGWFYLADEYDFAFPQVTSVYQPVLENGSLYIKEADEEWRHIEPHPNFYMAGTGNTNGAGDETGLFQGTNMQNAANYERYGIVHQVEYMEPKKEIRLLADKLNVDKQHVEPIVQYVNKIRSAYVDGLITNTAGQRVSLYMSKLYLLTGDYQKAAHMAFINRLPEACRKVASDLAQRHLG